MAFPLTRREAFRHCAHQVQLDAISPEKVQVVEGIVQPGSLCAGKHIRDVS